VTELIRTLNMIKTRREPGWLTPSQRAALVALGTAVRIPGSVNLYGAVGVGKTFLAWAAADALGLVYLPHIAFLRSVQDDSVQGIIVDNCLATRMFHRDVLKRLDLMGVRRAVLVSRHVIEDYGCCIRLEFNDSDRAHVCENLRSIGLYRNALPDSHLWSLMNPHSQEVQC
jgi:hypothetical protein